MPIEIQDIQFDLFLDFRWNGWFQDVGSGTNEFESLFFVDVTQPPVDVASYGAVDITFVLAAYDPPYGIQTQIPIDTRAIIFWGESIGTQRYVLRRTRGGVTKYLYNDHTWNTVDDPDQELGFIPHRLFSGKLGNVSVVPATLFVEHDYQTTDVYEVVAESVDPWDEYYEPSPAGRGRSEWVVCSVCALDVGMDLGKLIIQGELIS